MNEVEIGTTLFAELCHSANGMHIGHYHTPFFGDKLGTASPKKTRRSLSSDSLAHESRRTTVSLSAFPNGGAQHVHSIDKFTNG
jgi:hypothetical protein